MVVECQECGSETALGSRFCPVCGARLHDANPDKGGNLIRVALVLACLIPAIAAMTELIAMISRRQFSWPSAIDILLVSGLWLLFFLVYKGHAWAVIAIGLTLVASNALVGVYLLSIPSFNGISAATICLRVPWIVFGIYLMRSRDARAFAKSRQEARPRH